MVRARKKGGQHGEAAVVDWAMRQHPGSYAVVIEWVIDSIFTVDVTEETGDHERYFVDMQFERVDVDALRSRK